MQRTRGSRSLLPGLLLLASIAACSGGGSAAPRDAAPTGLVEVQTGGSLTVGADQPPTNFNINTSVGASDINSQILSGVLPGAFMVSPEQKVVLDGTLMTSATLTSEDPQTIVYEIRPEAVWSDGTPVSADDFVLDWEAQRGTDETFDAAGTSGYEDIDAVTGSNGGKTVTVVFATVFAEWKSLFSTLMPAHVLRAAPGGVQKAWNTAFEKGIPVSAGPFVFGEYVPGDNLTLKRNDAYFGEKAKLDSIVFRFLPDSTVQPDALRNGEVQLISPQPQLDLVEAVASFPGVRSSTTFGATYEHLTFNVEAPGLDDVEVRRAIALALDRQQIIDRTVGQFDSRTEPLGNRIYVQGQPGYRDGSGPYGQGDVEAATALLERAGYARGADGVYAKGGKKLSFRISTTAGNALRETQGELVQAQLEPVGIDIRIDNAVADVLFGERLPAGDFEIANFAWVGEAFVSFYADIFGTDGGLNFGKFSNAFLDDLVKKANSTLDDADRTTRWNAADAQLWEQMATLPLYQKPSFLAHSDKYGNIFDGPISGPFTRTGTWGLL